MLKKTIKYTNYNDEPVEKVYYFNISQTELTELELSIKGGFSSYVEHILNTKDTPALMDFFKMFITKAYGEKSLDGDYFNKSPEMSRQFMCSAAYDALYTELMSDPDIASNFIMSIVPKQFAEAMKNSMEKDERDAAINTAKKLQEQDKVVSMPTPVDAPLTNA